MSPPDVHKHDDRIHAESLPGPEDGSHYRQVILDETIDEDNFLTDRDGDVAQLVGSATAHLPDNFSVGEIHVGWNYVVICYSLDDNGGG